MKNLLVLSLLILLFSCANKQGNKEGFQYQRTQKETTTPTQTKIKKTPVDLSNKGVGPISQVSFDPIINSSLVEKGRIIFQQKCTTCHFPDKKFIGPAMKGIYTKRSPEWVMNMIINPERMIKEDPIAEALFEEYNRTPMLNQNISEEDARAIANICEHCKQLLQTKWFTYLCAKSLYFMIQSMTGFGKSVIQLPTKKITIELKSLNSKSLDLNARIPSVYREKELEMRNLIASALERGKIDFSLYIEVTGEETSSQLNEAIIRAYISQLKNVVDGDQTELLKMAVRMPDALKTSREELDEKEYTSILKALKEAIEAISTFRSEEGSSLKKEFELRIGNIKSLLEDVKLMDPDRLQMVRERLDRAVSDIREKVDENRFEQELIFYLEKFDITEEKVRLENHLDYFLNTLNTADSNGRKLGFICQEIGREINTMGSKANYAPMQQLVVQMKDELEKIKEQILNVL